MADVASPFNPEYERKHEETYDFRGADAAPAMRAPIAKEYDNSISNASTLFNVSIEGKDALYKNRIREEATADVDAIRDAWIGTSTSSGSPNANVPADLRMQGERLAKTTSSYRAGNINDRHYWAQMENIARATRSRYPGYREYIDNVISDLTGGTPANVLQRSISEEASKGKSSEEKEVQELITYAAKQGIYTEDMEGYDLPKLRQTVSEYQGSQAQVESELNKLKLTEARNDDVYKDADRALGTDVWTKIGWKARPSLDKIRAAVSQRLETGKNLTPDEVQQFGLESARIKSELLSILDESILNEAYVGKLRPQDVDAHRKSIIEFADSFSSAIQKGSVNAIDTLTAQLEVQTSGDARNLLDASVEARKGAAVAKVLGPEMADRLVNNQPGAVQAISKALNATFKNDLYNPETQEAGTPVVSALDRAANSRMPNQDKGKVIGNIVDSSVNGLTDPESNFATKVRSAENMFGDKNKDFLTFFSTSSNTVISKDTGMTRVAMFLKLNSPAVAKEMIALRDGGRADLYDRYKAWRDYSVTQVLLPIEMATLSKIPTDDQTMNIQFDEKTGKIISQDRGPGSWWDSAASWISGAKNSVSRFNGMIDAMTPAWKAEGLNPAEEARKLVEQAGVNFNAPKGDNLWTQLWQHIQTEAAVRNADNAAAAANVRNRRSAAGIDGQRMNLGVSNERSGIPDFSGGFKPVAYSQQQTDAVTATGKELRELYKLLEGTTDPQARQMIKEDIHNLRTNGENPMFSMGRNLGIYQAAKAKGVTPWNEPSMLGYGPNDRQSTNIEDRRTDGNPAAQKENLMRLLSDALEDGDDQAMGEIMEQLKTLGSKGNGGDATGTLPFSSSDLRDKALSGKGAAGEFLGLDAAKDGDFAPIIADTILTVLPGAKILKSQLSPYIEKGFNYLVIDKETGVAYGAAKLVRGAMRTLMRLEDQTGGHGSFRVESIKNLMKKAVDE